MRTAWELISTTFQEWFEDKAQRLGAALAYYAAFSVAPLLVIVVAITSRIYAGDSLEEIHVQVAGIMGTNAADALVATMRALQATSHGVFATVASIIAIFIGATGAFSSLQDSMNTIWEVTPKPRHFLVDILRTRLLFLPDGPCFLSSTDSVDYRHRSARCGNEIFRGFVSRNDDNLALGRLRTITGAHHDRLRNHV